MIREWSCAVIVLLVLVSAVGASSCSTMKVTPDGPEPTEIAEFSIQDLYKDKSELGCKAMLDGYCAHLYSPNVLGNLRVKSGSESILVLQGKTPNDFSAVYFEYAKAKLRNYSYLPPDFLEALTKRSFFEKLKQFIARRPRERMALSERLRSIRLGYEVDSLWDSAIEETVLRRMDLKVTGFHKIREDLIPVEMQVELRRARRILISQISKAIWRKHPNWKKVESSFEVLRGHFINVIGRLKIEDWVREHWLERIRSVKLVLPGAVPEISDRECATTKINAYYYSRLNMLTVCAGDFNSEDILETLAHEMAHTLDIDRAHYNFQISSEIGKALANLRNQVCKPTTFSCEVWQDFKSHFSDRLTKFSTYRPELPEFQRCLKRRATGKTLRQSDIERLAGTIISEKLSELAQSSIFLRITKEKIRLPNGNYTTNPAYLNPCAYNLWTLGEEALDDELSALLFFTAEYRCGQESSSAVRFEKAIDIAKEMSIGITRELLKSEGEFSSRHLLETEGFASSPAERFADVLGSYALANYLSTLSSTWDRRNTFLASSSWQCDKPSLESDFPEESNIQRKYVFDSHTEGDERKKEFLSQIVRETIGCKKDFEFNSCELEVFK